MVADEARKPYASVDSKTSGLQRPQLSPTGNSTAAAKGHRTLYENKLDGFVAVLDSRFVLKHWRHPE